LAPRRSAPAPQWFWSARGHWQEGRAWVHRQVAEALAYLARAAHGQGKLTHAARLFGAVAALREANGIVLSPADLEEHRRHRNRTRAELGEEPFEAAWKAGQEMAFQDMISLALDLKES
jgi:hypothetical protein